MRISDWSSDVCSSDLAARIALYRYWRTSHNGSRSTNALHAGDDGAGNDFLPRLLRRQSDGTARGNCRYALPVEFPFRHDCPRGAVTGPVAASGNHSLASVMGGIDRQAWRAPFPSTCYEIRRGRETAGCAFI